MDLNNLFGRLVATDYQRSKTISLYEILRDKISEDLLGSVSVYNDIDFAEQLDEDVSIYLRTEDAVRLLEIPPHKDESITISIVFTNADTTPILKFIYPSDNYTDAMIVDEFLKNVQNGNK